MLPGPAVNGVVAMINPDTITVRLHGITVGRIAVTQKGLCAFQYDPAYLQTGHSISPLSLPLTQTVMIAKPDPFHGGFGVFDDSLPDGWGRLVQDRVLRERGIDPNSLTVLQRLMATGHDGRGALEYEPTQPHSETPDGQVDLQTIAEAATKLLKSNETEASDLATLAQLGGSSGGARPKIFLHTHDGEWLVKFAAAIDPPNVGQVEYAYSLLAARCGVIMPETRLFDQKFFGVKRFDRSDSGKEHVVSAAGLLNADYRIPSLDYHSLMALTRQLTRDMAEVEQMFRRLAFNVTIGNRDDHAKNFSFMMTRDGKWKLTPAYDLLPSPGFNGFHTTTVNGTGQPTDDDVIEIGVQAGLTRRQAMTILGEIRHEAQHL